MNIYGSHYFIVMPFFRLTHESRRALDALRRQRRRGGGGSMIKSTAEAAGAMQKEMGSGGGGGKGSNAWPDFRFGVEWSKLCLFVAGPPSYDTLISLHSKWELFNAETDEILLATGGVAAAGPNVTGSTVSSTTAASSAAAHAAFPACNGGSGRSTHSSSCSAPGYVPASGMAGAPMDGGDSHHERGGVRTHAFGSLVSALRVEYSVLRQGDSRHLL